MNAYKVWFTGAHGTGKTTQMEYFLKFHPNYNRVEMERRNLFERGVIKVNKDAAPWDELVIAGTAMLSMLSTTAPFVSDRSWVCKCAYSQALPYPQPLLDAFHLIYVASFFGYTEADRYFYFPPIIELEDDGVRSTDPEYQKEIDTYIRFYLDLFQIDYYKLESSTVQDRHFEIEKELFGKL